ncbi:unnamed protein product [Rangifer tarandus platyrhynchus]|uniref:Uncharacterized protein n=1 Tax=Rangifer tarandus platyrhynchus TaxID=3082113 RepID=A0ABN8XI49_RANTA|nr:unnamed protein product [Rangifer tarandus platyrhynchus]
MPCRGADIQRTILEYIQEYCTYMSACVPCTSPSRCLCRHELVAQQPDTRPVQLLRLDREYTVCCCAAMERRLAASCGCF